MFTDGNIFMTLDGGLGQINTMKGPFLQTVDIFTAQGDSRSPILNILRRRLVDREVVFIVKDVLVVASSAHMILFLILLCLFHRRFLVTLPSCSAYRRFR